MNFVRITNYPNYVIHPCGTILRIYHHHTRELKHCKVKGYFKVNLCKGGKGKTFLVHRLLAIAFIPNPENKPYVDHTRGKHMGNSLDNLRWVTQQENMDGFRTNRPVPITKGYIRKSKYGWKWQYQLSGKRKYKTMKSLEALEIYRKKKLTSLQS